MKFLRRIALCLCLVFSAAILWACGKEDAKITGIYFKEGSVNAEVEQFSEYSTDNIKVIAKYDDGTEKEITGVTFQDISTNATGKQTLKASYEGFTCETTITVTAFTGERPYYVTGVFSPAFIETFEKKSNTQNEYDDQLNPLKADGETEKTKGFIKTGDYLYKVGNDNPFKFSPTISVTFFDENRRPDANFSSFPIAADVYHYNGTAYELIPSANLANYVEIDEDLHTFQFTDLAAKQGENKFKLEVRPDFEVIEGDGKYAIDQTKNRLNSVSFEIEVVDGWNVYNASDLSIVDNCNDEGKWTTLKTESGLINKTTNAVILHNDIDITTDYIPSIHIYSDSNTEGYQGADLEKVKGLMINEDGYDTKSLVYKRVISDNDDFTIEGNYYTISAENLPLVYDEGCEESIAVVCTTLFGFIDAAAFNDEKGAIDTTEESCYINNVSFTGNCKKDEVTGPAGMCCYKTENVNFTMDNCLSQAWYIAHYFEGSSLGGGEEVLTDVSVRPTHKLINCTSFDSFNTIMYCQGARDVIIEDSLLIGAGGPVMICDEEVDEYDKVGGGKETYRYATNVKVIDSKLESWLVGEESWFIQTGAGFLFSQITAMNQTISLGTGLSIVNGQSKANLISVFKSTKHIGDALTSYVPVNGSFNVEKEDVDPEENPYEYGLDFSYPERAYVPAGSHALQTFTGALISSDGTESKLPSAMLPIGHSDLATAEDEFKNRIKEARDYLGIYVANGMGAVFGASKAS